MTKAERSPCRLAEEALKKSIALSPGYPAYANLGTLYMQERRYPEAAVATEEALKINGNDYMVWNNLMIASEGAKEPKGGGGETKSSGASREGGAAETTRCVGTLNSGKSVRGGQDK